MSKLAWIFVPNNHRWFDISEKVDYLRSKRIDCSHIICDESDAEMRNNFKQFIAEVKVTIQNHYRHSQSFNWKPTDRDEVFWLTVSYPSWMHTLRCKHSKKAAAQFDSSFNCYKTEQEVTALKGLIEALFLKYGI